MDNPNVDVNDLMARVHDEVMQREEERAPAPPGAERTYVYASELDASTIEALLVTARKMAQPRTTWPRRLWIFPFNVSAWLRRSLLRFFAFLFNDQRHVDFALAEAIRELLQLNKEMHGIVAGLQSEVRDLEARLVEIESRHARK